MSDIFMVICALLGVIGLIFLTLYATKWLNKKFRNTGWNGSRNGIEIIECMGIAQDKQLLAVKAGSKAMLLGVTSNSVTFLSELDESDIAAMKQLSDTDSGQAGFMESLKKALSGKTSDNTEADIKDGASSNTEQKGNYRENGYDDL